MAMGGSRFKARCTCQDSILAPWCRHIVGLLLYFAKHRNKGINVVTENNHMSIENTTSIGEISLKFLMLVPIQKLIDKRIKAFENSSESPDLNEVNCLIFNQVQKKRVFPDFSLGFQKCTLLSHKPLPNPPVA